MTENHRREPASNFDQINELDNALGALAAFVFALLELANQPKADLARMEAINALLIVADKRLTDAQAVLDQMKEGGET